MKRVVIAGLLMLSALTLLSGCADSIVGQLIKKSVTKDVNICDGLDGMTIAQVEERLGSPDRVKRENEGIQVRTYKRGYFTGLITFDKNGKVIGDKMDCSKE